MSEIRQTYTITAPIEQVWQALIDPNIIDEWGGGPSEMSEVNDAEFTLWGGDITGTNIEVTKPTKLVQLWGYDTWEKPSTVTFELKARNNQTDVTLIQRGHPDSEHTELEHGWNDYYLGAVKELLERG